MKTLKVLIITVGCALLAQAANADVWEALAKFEYTDGNNVAQQAEHQLQAIPVADYPKVEAKLIALLSSKNATVAGKSIACRLLQRIGTDKAVPTLSALLADEILCHYALLPLERLQSPKADKAMRDALDKAPAKAKVSLVGSIGERRDTKALKVIQALAKGKDAAVAGAAIQATGKIANEDAAKFLVGLEVAESLEPVYLDALLACAEHLEGSQSAALYEKVLDSSRTHYQIASLKGLVHADGSQGAKLIVKSLKGDDARLRKGVLSLVASEPGDALTKAVTAALGDLGATQQAEVITTLGARGDSAALADITKFVKSKDADVRNAAISAVGQLGDAGSILLLLELGQDKALASSTSAAIARMQGEGINDALIAAMNNKDLQVPALKAIVARGGKAAAPSLLKLVDDSSAALRKEAWTGLAMLAGDSDLGPMTKASTRIKDDKEQGFALAAVKRAFSRAKDKEASFNGIAEHFDSSNDVTKGLVLDLAADVGNKRALELERKALESKNEELRQKAIRALADWANATASDDLLKLATGAKANRDRILALRGYIRIAGMDGAGINSAERTAMLKQADALATRLEEKRLIVGNLRNAGTPEALTMLIGYMKDNSLKQEAELSAADLIWTLRLIRSDKVMKLAEELTGSSNNAVAQKARACLADMNKANAYLRNWSYVGPFQERNKDGRAIFKMVFPPEKPGAAGVPWSSLQKGISNEVIDLQKAIRNMSNCCAYVQTRIVSDKDQQVRLEMGSDDGIRAWVNGTLVHSNYQERACTPGQDIARINLKKGENIILLKIVQQSGGWAFSCRLMNNNGNAVKGLKVLAN